MSVCMFVFLQDNSKMGSKPWSPNLAFTETFSYHGIGVSLGLNGQRSHMGVSLGSNGERSHEART